MYFYSLEFFVFIKIILTAYSVDLESNRQVNENKCKTPHIDNSNDYNEHIDNHWIQIEGTKLNLSFHSTVDNFCRKAFDDFHKNLHCILKIFRVK
ncbi:hypothetical protein EHP00_1942 [Ecytonucleospora hepatopenaei]|uniref:Uncharacterized protein n=1 Tax=Ecytonucleospora hepatopenaei TaxID=646526 RepID=A0A1W0E961_9MICR|nr:hypothetical protein EHP00_1942 [Ecytonucleospora hepatopenaei]